MSKYIIREILTASKFVSSPLKWFFNSCVKKRDNSATNLYILSNYYKIWNTTGWLAAHLKPRMRRKYVFNKSIMASAMKTTKSMALQRLQTRTWIITPIIDSPPPRCFFPSLPWCHFQSIPSCVQWWEVSRVCFSLWLFHPLHQWKFASCTSSLTKKD